jgi:hypothetical protein
MNASRFNIISLILLVFAFGLVTLLIGYKWGMSADTPEVEVYTSYGMYYLDFKTLTATCENSEIKREFTSHTDMTDWLAYITARDVNLSEVVPADGFIAEPMSLLDEDSLLVLKVRGAQIINDSTTRLIRDTLGYVMIDRDGNYHFHKFEDWYQ